jgi:branched-chain amino acid transport system ATP-binding protein
MSELLRVDNLSVYYGYVNALQNVSIHVNEGEIITLIGGNGAGKTTTLMSISNLVDKAEGSVTFRGEDITRKAPDKIVKMGISHVPEGRKIFPQLTVYENLVAGTFGKPGTTKERMNQLMEQNFVLFPRLKERAKQAGGSLSGGEQQMLAIARGLMMDPALIMLDEPSLGLAPIIVEEIFELILRIREGGTTVLLIEQNASMALSIADRGYVLETGKMTLTGTGAELAVNEDVKKAYLGA